MHHTSPVTDRSGVLQLLSRFSAVLRRRHDPPHPDPIASSRIALQRRAAEVAGDPEFKRWAAGVRDEVASGMPSDQLVGKDELLRRMDALRRSS